MLKPLALYMMLNVFNSLMIFSALFENQFSAVRKVLLDEFLWRKGIPFILKNQIIVRFSCYAEIYILAVEPLVPSRLGF